MSATPPVVEQPTPVNVAVADLVPHPRNYREHPEEQVAALRASLRANGVYRNVVAASDLVLLAGHGVVAAARAEGLLEIPVVVFPFPHTDPRAERILVADNELQRGAVDDEAKMASVLADVQKSLGLEGTGWDDNALQRMITRMAADEFKKTLREDTEPAEPPAKPHTNPGDIWLLGPHRVICGDSTDPIVIERLFGDAQGSMIWIDPPYGVDYGNHDHPTWGKHAAIANDALDNDGMAKLWCDAINALSPYVDGDLYVCSPAGPLLRLMDNALETTPWERHQWLVWVKNSLVLGRSNYHYRHEQIWYGWRTGGASSWVGDRKSDSVFEVDRPTRSDVHPTMKPVVLVGKMVLNSAPVGGIVADTFLGSGSTLIACEQTDRICYGCELEPGYCDVVVKRWQDATGLAATLEATGAAFPVPPHPGSE